MQDRHDPGPDGLSSGTPEDLQFCLCSPDLLHLFWLPAELLEKGRNCCMYSMPQQRSLPTAPQA